MKRLVVYKKQERRIIMFFAKSNLMKCFIIIYLCTFLTGVPFVASSLAKITIKDQSKQLQVITIK